MQHILVWFIAALIIVGILFKPFRIPEYIWAVVGATLLVVLQLLSPSAALTGILKGTDVYLFLTGMMLLSETAKEEKLFDWLAAKATNHAGGFSVRLFLLIYLVGIVVTVFMSNDATAIVLTPAVAAVVRAAKVEKALPYLFICAFVANAASFVLPISNPANLVLYGSHVPALLQWLPVYFLPSVVAIAVTGMLLYWSQRKYLHHAISKEVATPRLTPDGKIAFVGIGITTIVLLVCSYKGIELGFPTIITGALTSIAVLIRAKKGPKVVIKGVNWSIIPLVAGLFVMVTALDKTGLIAQLRGLLQDHAATSVNKTAWGSGIAIAFTGNIINNLPAGLIASGTLQSAHFPELIRNAVLIGVDLGPNLSVTGSLATILWLAMLRRENIKVSALDFLKLGWWIMSITLLCTLAVLFL